MATLKDVARLSGVTVTTISRMLNNRANVSEKTKAKILAAMEELDYHPNELAQSLIKQKSSFIGLIVPSAKHFFFGAVIGWVERFVCANGYKLLLCVSDLDAQKEIEYFHMLKSNKVAGVILASHTQNLLDHVNVANLPVVTIDRTLAPSIPNACADNYSGGWQAAEHLLGKGCQHLAYISGSAEMEMDANKRFVGFCDACHQRGAALPVMVDASERDFISMRYQPVIHHLFQTHPQVDGVFCSNDIIAAQVLQYCSQQGIEVPHRLKVVGYDDTDLACLTTPPLTTIHQPVEDLCRWAVERIVAGAEAASPDSVVLPVTLVEREST